MKSGLILLLLINSVALFAQGTTSIGGYGELHYNKNTYSPGKPRTDRVGTFDFHRFVVFLGHDFSEKVSFKSELEVEHGQVKSSNTSSELSVEQAYVDVKLTGNLGLRAGIMLVPVGIINEYHEPNTFNGVERPSVDRVIIPTTWRDAGIGLFGKWGDEISWRIYMLAGLDPSKLSEAGIRSGRQSAYYSKSSDMAVTGRVEYVPTIGLKSGFSFYTSSLENSAQNLDTLAGVRLSMVEADLQYSANNLTIRALGAYGMISEADKLNKVYGKNVGDSHLGYYTEVGYNVLPLLLGDTEHSLIAFGRYEFYDTQLETGSFATRQNGTEVTEFTTGLTWLPDPNVAFKLDYQWIDSNGSDAMSQKLNLGVGYYFY